MLGLWDAQTLKLVVMFLWVEAEKWFMVYVGGATAVLHFTFTSLHLSVQIIECYGEWLLLFWMDIVSAYPRTDKLSRWLK